MVAREASPRQRRIYETYTHSVNQPIDPETVFSTALEIVDVGERERYLAKACAGDAALRERVDRLLDAASESQRLFPDGHAAADRGDVLDCLAGRRLALERTLGAADHVHRSDDHGEGLAAHVDWLGAGH